MSEVPLYLKGEGPLYGKRNGTGTVQVNLHACGVLLQGYLAQKETPIP